MNKLARIRKDRGISQDVMAKSVGLSQSTVCKYESGSRKPSPEVAERIRKYLNLTIEEMWDVLYKTNPS